MQSRYTQCCVYNENVGYKAMKQKILIITKFYYRRGGDCIYALNLERLLRDQGHDVAVFAMQYPDNLPSSWSVYWPSEISFNGGVRQKLAALRRTLGMGDVRERFSALLADFKPDIVHLNNIHSYLSPVVARMARQAGAKVVWTLHDYKLICPSYSCLRDDKPCELCFKGKLPVLSTRCMKGSLAASAIAFLEAEYWNRSKLQRATDRFICPSRFMAAKMAQGGFDSKSLHTLCNFIAPEMAARYRGMKPSGRDSDYYCYVGRLSKEKGVATLLKAASGLPYRLKIAGDGPMSEELRRQYAVCGNIEFLGHLESDAVSRLLAGSRFSIIPSEWYENNPLGVIESFCAGTPVVGAAIGGIPELIDTTRGLTFASGDADDLSRAVSEAWSADFDREAMQCRALEEFSPEGYYGRLISEIYD